MPAIVDFPHVVREAREQFADLFSCEPQRQHFAEYLTGLMVARNKTVTGINVEFADTTDPSCLNRFLTQVDWDVDELNERRLELLQKDPSTRYHDQGVIALDDVLIDHTGKFIKDVGWFWDHAEERNKIAHDYLFANYVTSSGKHYPLELRSLPARSLRAIARNFVVATSDNGTSPVRCACQMWITRYDLSFCGTIVETRVRRRYSSRIGQDGK